MKPGPARFELRGVYKSFPVRNSSGKTRLEALRGIGLKIEEGVVTALMGPSGSGKSTLARILLRLEKADQGEILFQGRPLADWPLAEFRRRNQIVFQNPYLAVNPALSIYSIMSEPLRIAGASSAFIREKLQALCEILAVNPELWPRRPNELSGGQLQRVVFARALSLEPDFLVLDEPFSALDEIMAARLLDHCRRVFRQLGIGVLYISHHYQRVRFLADRVNLLQDGKISLSLSSAEFFGRNQPGTPGARKTDR